MDMPSGFSFSALNRRTAALCASDLCLFTARLLARLCWTADMDGQICFRFGLGCVGPVVVVVVVADAVGLSSSPVNGDRSALLIVTIGSFLTVGVSRWGVICFASRASRRQRIILRTVSLAMSFLGNPTRIMAHGTLTSVVVLRIRTASSTFFWCAALFFGVLSSGVFSVETD